METYFTTGYSNNSVNFCALKSVKGIDKIECALGHRGKTAGNHVIEKLKVNPAFEKLCSDYDVFVSLLPVIKPSKKPCLTDIGMRLEIFVQKINKIGLSSLLGKKSPQMTVVNYSHAEPEAKIFDIKEYIIENFINNKNGLEDDINIFYIRMANKVK